MSSWPSSVPTVSARPIHVLNYVSNHPNPNAHMLGKGSNSTRVYRLVSRVLFPAQTGEILCRPQPPPLVAKDAPSSPDVYFGIPICMWLPRRLWGVLPACPECGAFLNPSGYHSRLRKAVDLGLGYWVATERLVCPKCSPTLKVFVGWNHRLIRQLDQARDSGSSRLY